MRLYLVQHGEAEPEDVNPARPLSKAGSNDIHNLGRWLLERNCVLGRILHSGKLRAQQSADIIAEHLGMATATGMLDGLAPNDAPADIIDQLNEWRQSETTSAQDNIANNDVLLVGHLPFMSRLTNLLTHGGEHAVVDFVPGTLVCLEYSDSSSILSVVRPDWFGITGD